MPEQIKDILDLFKHQDWCIDFEAATIAHIAKFLRYYPRTQNILWQLVDYLSTNKIIIPSYRKLQDLFASAFSIEKTDV